MRNNRTDVVQYGQRRRNFMHRPFRLRLKDGAFALSVFEIQWETIRRAAAPGGPVSINSARLLRLYNFASFARPTSRRPGTTGVAA
jgi:hypothetical protein